MSTSWHRFMCAPGTPRRLTQMIEDNARIDRPSSIECPVCGRRAWLDRTRTDRVQEWMCSDGHLTIGPNHAPMADATGEP